MDIKNISDKIYSGEDHAKKEEINKIYYEMAEYIKKHDGAAYRMFLERAEDICYNISLDEAKLIVHDMEPYGEKWNYESVKEYLKNRGTENKTKWFYLVMNMAYNDYHRTAQQYNVDSPDFYYDIAYDFINDPDGGKHKVPRYFAYK